MLYANKIRDLNLRISPQSGRPSYLSAASGLVVVRNHFYVVADDEVHLGIFELDAMVPGSLCRLWDRDLPLEHHERKKTKPDLEAIARLPASHGLEESLLLVPSGSKNNRVAGVLIFLDDHGDLSGQRSEIDFAPLYNELSTRFTELNIEGAVVSGSSLKLFQRGNGVRGENAVIDLDLEDMIVDLRTGRITSRGIRGVEACNLGQLRGSALSFTDATLLPNGQVAFLAAAEASANTYEDGACEGSVFGLLGANNEILYMDELSPKMKAEGLDSRMVNGQLELLVVTDDDDIERRAQLYRFVV